MKFNRSGVAQGLLAASGLVLSACGSTTDSSSGSSGASAPAQCGGTKKLAASGATAQENALTRG